MDNQHRKIKGYRELDETEIEVMNQIKQSGIELGELMTLVSNHLDTLTRDGTLDHAAEPRRWMAIAKTNLQQGLMALTRAVAQPGFF